MPENEIRFLRKVHETCQADRNTYQDEKILRRLLENQNDRQVGIHMLCMAEAAGLMTHDGTLNRKTIKEKIAIGAKKGASVDNLLSECAQNKNDAVATAMHLWVCFIQNAVHYYHRL